MKFNNLSKEIYEANKEKGWDNDNFVERLCLIHSEVSEALEDYRNNKEINELYMQKDNQGNKKPNGIPSELADIIIRVLDTCGKYNIDIDDAIEKKLKYNKTREYRHGDKKC